MTTVSVSSTGGFTALAFKKFCSKSTRTHHIDESKEKQNENRSYATKQSIQTSETL
jgi:hypothetical protein